MDELPVPHAVGRAARPALGPVTRVRRETVDAVLARLGLDRPAPDHAGLRQVYAAWCRAVPFDNSRKMIHVAEARPGPLPGSTPEDFFAAWLAYGTGATCWAGNGALQAFLAALGFDATRAIATMLPQPDLEGPNHGSVIVRLDGEPWIADASILSGTPLRLLQPGDPERDGPLPRPGWHDGKPAVIWQAPPAPDGFPCRFDRIGAGDAEWDALHQRTATWSPFNYQLGARLLLRDGTSIGIGRGKRFAFAADGSLEETPLDQEGRIRFLVEEIGIAEELAVRVPDDREPPSTPDDAAP